MIDHKKDIGLRAIACKRWRWMPGMLAIDSSEEENDGRVINDSRQLVYESPQGSIYDGDISRCDIPDLTDPATLGCLLALVREAWPTAPAVTSRHGTYAEGIGHSYLWVCSYCTPDKWHQAHGDTEADALVVALEAAQ